MAQWTHFRPFALLDDELSSNSFLMFFFSTEVDVKFDDMVGIGPVTRRREAQLQEAARERLVRAFPGTVISMLNTGL